MDTLDELQQAVKEQIQANADLRAESLYHNDLYGLYIIGRFKVLFADTVTFSNGGCVVIYKLQKIAHKGVYSGLKHIVKAKAFYMDSTLKEIMPNDTDIIIKGTLENESFKDKNENWVNNGGFIMIEQWRKAYDPDIELQRLKDMPKLEAENESLRKQLDDFR